RALVQILRIGATTDLRAEVKALDVPVLIVHGTADASTPIDLTARKALPLLADGRLVEIDGAGHGLYVNDAPRVVAEILAFGGRAQSARLGPGAEPLAERGGHGRPGPRRGALVVLLDVGVVDLVHGVGGVRRVDHGEHPVVPRRDRQEVAGPGRAVAVLGRLA